MDAGLPLFLPFHAAGDLADTVDELHVSRPFADIKDPVCDSVDELVMRRIGDGDPGTVQDRDDSSKE